MQQRIKTCDCVVEVHDARVSPPTQHYTHPPSPHALQIPFSGRNHQFDLFGARPRVLVMNKADLADQALKPVRRPLVHVMASSNLGR
jgi:hypothetical protein